MDGAGSGRGWRQQERFTVHAAKDCKSLSCTYTRKRGIFFISELESRFRKKANLFTRVKGTWCKFFFCFENILIFPSPSLLFVCKLYV